MIVRYLSFARAAENRALSDFGYVSLSSLLRLFGGSVLGRNNLGVPSSALFLKLPKNRKNLSRESIKIPS
jgi:hypothetical protein